MINSRQSTWGERAMADSKASTPASPKRREFLQKGAHAGAAAVVGSTLPSPVDAAPPTAAFAPLAPVAPLAPLAPQAAQGVTPIMTAAGEAIGPGEVQVLGENQRAGSDFMLDVLKSLNFEYVALNPGSSFRGLHESIINYGGNHAPEMITCMHEESAVA